MITETKLILIYNLNLKNVEMEIKKFKIYEL